ncbi:MAG: hypothetical protein SGJ11_14880 [Phycisphaerae bacterium]|nr:hypothetical protein [Phycisphaerae bacterium]
MRAAGEWSTRRMKSYRIACLALVVASATWAAVIGELWWAILSISPREPASVIFLMVIHLVALCVALFVGTHASALRPKRALLRLGAVLGAAILLIAGLMIALQIRLVVLHSDLPMLAFTFFAFGTRVLGFCVSAWTLVVGVRGLERTWTSTV